MVFNTGDLTDLGSEESNWQKYFEITAPLGAITPVVPALGNHDGERRGLGAAMAWELFGVPARDGATPPPGWTSLDYGGVHFVILSTNDMANMAQRDWLRADLARAKENHARAIFAFCHEGPWSHGIHGNSEVMGRVYAPILAAAHVDVLFSGHDHIYERGVGSTPVRQAELRRDRRRRRAPLPDVLPRGIRATAGRHAGDAPVPVQRPGADAGLPLHHGRGRQVRDHHLSPPPRRDAVEAVYPPRAALIARRAGG